MANPQHIEWLLEGVKAWNAQRQRANFIPDLSGILARNIFGVTGLLKSDRPIPLDFVNLQGAILQGAGLYGASLRGANLQQADLLEADLSGVDLQEANLQGADLRSAGLQGADLREADLQGADVRTITGGTGSNGYSMPVVTDLSDTANLNQKQLDTMLGDSGTLLPDHLTRPEHWPELDIEEDAQLSTDKDSLKPNKKTFETTSQQNRPGNLPAQVTFLLDTAPAASESAHFAATQIRAAVAAYHNQSGLNTSDEGQAFDAVADAFDTLADSIENAASDPEKIAALQATIEAQRQEIERLTALITDLPSPKSQIMVSALGGAGATAIAGVSAYIFGPEGATMISNIWSMLTTAPPTPPVIGP